MTLNFAAASPAPTPDCETLYRMSLPELLYHVIKERITVQRPQAQAA